MRFLNADKFHGQIICKGLDHGSMTKWSQGKVEGVTTVGQRRSRLPPRTMEGQVTTGQGRSHGCQPVVAYVIRMIVRESMVGAMMGQSSNKSGMIDSA